jgi:sortase (surface protein transpeptidase)
VRASRRARPPARARPGHAVVWLALLLGLAACTGAPPRQEARSHRQAGSPAASSSARAAADPPNASVVQRTPRPPVRIEIPAIGVSAGVIRLGLNRDGSMQVPADFGLTGWFTGSPTPGETGPAVIAGHIDSRSGPAVFYRLRALRPGDRIAVARTDGTTVHFAVDNVAQYPKRAFPTEAVFGPAPEPLLRLITCGGTFDYFRRSYRDNVVVTAHLV